MSGALSWEQACKRDCGTQRLIGMIDPAVLREGDTQPPHAPLRGREGRTMVSKRMDGRITSILGPCSWIRMIQEHSPILSKHSPIKDCVQDLPKGWRRPNPRMRRRRSNPRNVLHRRHARVHVHARRWIHGFNVTCAKWRNVGDKSQPGPDANFVCSDVEKHTCGGAYFRKAQR